jgi:NAD(P)-dependent dehydrogenase (short-subunit alcohol dehydrogenase family)
VRRTESVGQLLLFAEHGATAVIADVDEAAAPEVADEIVTPGATPRHSPPTCAPTRVDRPREHALNDGRIDARQQRRSLPAARPFDKSEPEMWQELYEINLLHVFRATHAPAAMLEHRGSDHQRVVGGGRLRLPTRSVYGAFKAAVIHFTKCLRSTSQGEAANAVGPDLTQSQQVDYETSTPGRNLWPIWAPWGVGVNLRIRHGRSSSSPASSEFIVGQTLLTDGGTGAAGGWFRTERREGRRWTNRPIDPESTDHSPVVPSRSLVLRRRARVPRFR